MPACIALLACMASTASAQTRPATSAAPPNFVLILADDLGWGDVGFNGRRDWATPNLDRLATQGTVFTRWYSGATVCCPSRAVLLTGKYTIHNRVCRNNDDLPAEEVTIAEALRPRGYRTALFGKWHHGQPRPGQSTYVHPMDQGFDEFFGFTDARHAWEKYPKELWFGREKRPVAGYATTMFTDRAVDFLQRHKDGPFFLYLAYTDPHFYIQAPAEDVDRYRGKFPEKDPDKPGNATYAAMITRLDAEVGRVLSELDELGLADRTVVLFTSDNGATFETGNQGASAFHDSNRPLRGQKRTLYEGGIRMPTVLRWPGHVPAGRSSRAPMHNIDVLPTFLAAAGGQPDPAWRVDGHDMLGLWQGQSSAPDRTLFWEWRSEGANILAAMRGDLKAVSACGDKYEIYNVETDPAERRDLSSEQGELKKQLVKEIQAWLATEVK